MRTEQLSKLLIMASNDEKREVISRLQHVGVMHIAKAKPEDLLELDTPTSDIDQISHLLLKLKYIAKQTKLNFPFVLEGLPPREKVIILAGEFVEKNLTRIEHLSLEKSEIIKKQSKLKAERKSIEALPFETKKFKSERQTSVIILSDEEISKYPFSVKVKVEQVAISAKAHYTEILVLNKDLLKFQNSLRKSSGKQINLPKMPLGSKKYLQTIKKKDQEYQQKIQEIESDLFKRINGKQSQIQFLITSLENYRKQSNISSNFLRSQNFFVIQGYVKTDEVQRIQNTLPETTIYALPAESDAPSKLKNHGFAKNFEKITTMFGTPSYSLIDPTPLVSIFFPLFFGFMLSDVGYGFLLLLSVAVIYFHLGDKFEKIAIILGTSALSSIFFGIVFGSFFGNLIQITPLYQDSFTASFMILKISLLIGLVHINLGVALKIYQEFLKKTQFSKALDKILPIPLIQGIMISLYFQKIIIATIFIVLLVYILFKEKGLFGITVITNFFGTWFSYARLLALCLATAGVALAVNIIAQKALSLGKLGILLWFIILGLGHLFNFVLNVLGCAIHSTRLHYVEFFSLFFEGEGYPFKEFKVQRETNIED